MKALITDRKVFESLRPVDIAAYLRSSGWTLAGYMGEAATVWKKADVGDAIIQVPADTTFADYARRIADILDTLGVVENRSQLGIVKDLATASADVIRLRVASSTATDGSMALEHGVTLFESAKDILLSAARATVSPRAYFRSRLPGPADEYMRKVKLGQTEIGSYVVTLVCPVSPELQATPQSSAEAIEEPFDRRVTRTLAGALDRVVKAARSAAILGNMQPFTSAVSEGVSANLCNALADIGDDIDDGLVEISFSWSRSRTRPQVPSSNIVVPHDAIPVMREAARVLKETSREDDFELVGPVVGLTSPSSSSGGDVTIHALLDRIARRVKVHLAAEDYSKALHAHDRGCDVRCRGRLEKEGRGYVLRNARDFSVSDDDWA